MFLKQFIVHLSCMRTRFFEQLHTIENYLNPKNLQKLTNKVSEIYGGIYVN